MKELEFVKGDGKRIWKKESGVDGSVSKSQKSYQQSAKLLLVAGFATYCS